MGLKRFGREGAASLRGGAGAERPRRLSFVGLLAICACLCATFPATAATPAIAQDLSSCVASLRPSMLSHGIAPETFDAATAGLTVADVLRFERDQPEFSIPIWDYMAGLVDDERVRDGLAAQNKYAETLRRIEARFGVDPATLVAFWGVESNYGQQAGRFPVVQALATLSCYGSKPAYYRGELASALAILQRGDVKADEFTGSWAGAFGHTQFMPSTFLSNAVDMEGTGHADIVGSVADALGSTANYLRKSGWVRGLPWGYEVRLPSGYKGPSGRHSPHPGSFWTGRGIRRVDGGAIGPSRQSLLLPAGASGPAFLVTRNFDAIFTYNAAETYSLAVGTLSDRLRGGGPLSTPWPTDDPGLSRAERREMQRLLTSAGYDVGEPDGTIGQKTRSAIADFEHRRGMVRNGRASLKVLEALRAGQ